MWPASSGKIHMNSEETSNKTKKHDKNQEV